MITAVYRYCSNPYGLHKLYSNSRCEVVEFLNRWVKIRLLEPTTTRRVGDIMCVLRKNVTIQGLCPQSTVRPDRSTIRLPYKDE